MFTRATCVPVYLRQRASPWQRGSNENANGPPYQFFPKRIDLSVHDRVRPDAVAARLNARPRKSLDWQAPAERLAWQLALLRTAI